MWTNATQQIAYRRTTRRTHSEHTHTCGVEDLYSIIWNDKVGKIENCVEIRGSIAWTQKRAEWTGSGRWKTLNRSILCYNKTKTNNNRIRMTENDNGQSQQTNREKKFTKFRFIFRECDWALKCQTHGNRSDYVTLSHAQKSIQSDKIHPPPHSKWNVKLKLYRIFVLATLHTDVDKLYIKWIWLLKKWTV